MSFYRLSIILLLSFFLTSCLKENAYKNDYLKIVAKLKQTFGQKSSGIYKENYNVLTSTEISKIVEDNTIDYISQEKRFLTYYSYDKQYFTLYLGNDENSTDLNTSVVDQNQSTVELIDFYDKGTWTLSDYTIQGYSIGTLCKTSNSRSNLHTEKFTRCNKIMMNGIQWYLDDVNSTAIQIKKGPALILKEILDLKHKDTKALESYESVVGKHPFISTKKEEILAEIKKQQKALFDSQPSYQDGGSIELCIPYIPYNNKQSYSCRAKTASSSYKNATVQLKKDYRANCYTLNIYGGIGYGKGTTCSGASGGWSVYANGSNGYTNGLSAAITWLLLRM